MVKVIKKDGKVEEFSKEKMIKAIVRAGAKKSDAEVIAKKAENEFAKRDAVTSYELRSFVINELDKIEKNLAKSFSEFVKVKRKIAEREEALDKKIISLCGRHGKVRHVYGGYEIEVIDEIGFDYPAIFIELIKNRKMKVYVEEKEGKIVILARP